jgi:hypothetical protein
MEEKPKRRWKLLAGVLLAAVLYIPSFGPAVFFYQKVDDDSHPYVRVIAVVYAPLLAYLNANPDSSLHSYVDWWGQLGAVEVE